VPNSLTGYAHERSRIGREVSCKGLADEQFSFAPQIDLRDHKHLGVSFKIGDGPPTTISTAFGNISVTRGGCSGSSKGVNFVYQPDAEPYISNSGDLTREKIAKLVEMAIDNVGG
jgi:hypothetical protein